MQKVKITISEKNIQEFNGDLLVFFASGSQEEKEIICDNQVALLLKPLIEYGDFRAKENETALFYPQPHLAFAARRVLVIGLGNSRDEKGEPELRELWRSSGGTIGKICEKHKSGEVMVCLDGVDLGLGRQRVVESLTEGILLSDYRFTKYKKEDEEKPVFGGIKKISFHAEGKAQPLRKAAKRAARLAAAVHSARDMANEPGNGWTAAHFADHAETLAGKLPLTCRVFDKTKLKRLGLGGMLAVNQGSADPPRLVILEYTPEVCQETVVLVGKGLTFDSGGISLKQAKGMQDMKFDMCGGAAVMAAMEAIATEKPPMRVIGLVPATDNMSGSSALKPGDVIRHYNGVTSEIVNTDAEGRLILADAIAYAIKEYAPDCVVDVATLTGGVIVALGHHHTGVMGNDDGLIEALLRAGEGCGEPLWRLPLGKEYSKQIESNVADIKNAGGREGASITAACYLENFVGDTPWAHLDIAGTAWNFTEKSYIPKGPGGIMVRTLVEFIRNKG